MIEGRTVLIVEDEALVAAELAAAVRGAGGRVLGPVAGNREALALLACERPDAALLDLALADGEATPTAERLVALGVPILACTAGVLPRALRLALPDLPIQRKPINALRLATALARLLGSGADR
jgi:CheY-like chemotaxis protein